MNFNCVNNLIQIANRAQVESLLFNTKFGHLTVTGIFFVEPITFLIAIPNKNVAWQFMVGEDQQITPGIPKEVYRAVIDDLILVTGENKTTPLFRFINNFLQEANETHFRETNRAEIGNYLALTRTQDRDYDEEGELPFFLKFRRNPKGSKPSVDNLKKTGKNFGSSVRSFCYHNRVSSCWTDRITNRTLDFLAIGPIMDELRSKYSSD